MAKNNQPQTDSEKKIQTKYDRKMEERRKQEEIDKRNSKLMRIGAIVVCVAIVAAIAVSIITPILSKRAATNDAYVTIGSHPVTKLEYDYFYNASVNNYVNTYGSMLAYVGLDATKDFDEQQYSEEMTWKDFFDQMTVDQIKQTKSLADDAAANNFTYDDTEEYADIMSGIASGAESEGLSLKDFYKSAYGEYATEKNMEPLIKEGLLASAYYKHLIEQNAPEEQEVRDYYAEHVQDYDRVDYRSFTIAADIAEGATDEDIDKAMMDAKNKADAMMEARQDGADFKELCLENATEENKADYEDTETDASLREGAYYSSTASAIADWLYEDGRAEGDITVIEDMTSHQYYVVEFINRYYDETDDENISNTIASERAMEYLDQLMENYNVTDNKGDLKYLTIDTSAEEDTSAEASETEE